jgi:hypothetical protein
MLAHMHKWKLSNIVLDACDSGTAEQPFIVWKNATHFVYENIANPVA